MDAHKDQEFHEAWSPAETSDRGAQLDLEGGIELCRGLNDKAAALARQLLKRVAV